MKPNVQGQTLRTNPGTQMCAKFYAQRGRLRYFKNETEVKENECTTIIMFCLHSSWNLMFA